MSAEHDGPRAFALVTGGGTGGHVYPALAIADELVRRGHPRGTIHFVGAARGLEARVVPAAGYSIDLLPGRGLQRSLRPRAILDNLAALWATVRAFGQAWRIVGSRRPEVVIGVGGYASMPGVLAARLRRIPVVIHEQNAAPGLANRVAVRLGARPRSRSPARRCATRSSPATRSGPRSPRYTRLRWGRGRSSARSAAASARVA